MGHIVTIHSYRGGTGKSNLTANIAYQAALRGKRVAILDTDLQSPGVHMILGLEKERVANTLTDYLFGRCDIEDCAYDISSDFDLGNNGGGALYLLPSSMKLENIVRIVSEGYDVGRLNDHLRTLVNDLNLDLLLLDTHPGLNEETLSSTSTSDLLLLVVRPDKQDLHGTAVLMEVARRLNVPNTFIIANKVPSGINPDRLRDQLQGALGCEVIALLPLTEEVVMLGSRELFTKRYPDLAISLELKRATERGLSALFGSDESQ